MKPSQITALILFVLLGSLAAHSAKGQEAEKKTEPKEPSEQAEKIDYAAMLEDLQSESFIERAKAEHGLEQAGIKALDALATGFEHSDKVTRETAKKLVTTLLQSKDLTLAEEARKQLEALKEIPGVNEFLKTAPENAGILLRKWEKEGKRYLYIDSPKGGFELRKTKKGIIRLTYDGIDGDYTTSRADSVLGLAEANPELYQLLQAALPHAELEEFDD